jgi:hypothetical protein
MADRLFSTVSIFSTALSWLAFISLALLRGANGKRMPHLWSRKNLGALETGLSIFCLRS